jgi:NOL1/NOP2/sun family putative RNA methylase
MKQLSPVYLQTMQRLLEDEYDAFLQASSSPASGGLRANTLKISPHDLVSSLPYDLSPVAWCPAGFQLVAELGGTSPGRHPYHSAGLYYLQEPSAMAVAELLNPQPGERVLDLCAAPGGKSTHLAARMGGKGLLVANESHPRRVWELAENLERWGVRNTIILNESPARLADDMPDFFDRVLVDAPCSGEGMFRKSEAARRDWSPELVQSCALRQSAILEDGARLTRPGGVLAYSTCTFNPTENERTLAGFLERRPDFELVQTTPRLGWSPGRPDWIEGSFSHMLERSVRLWPHLAAGEGHFIAVMRRMGDVPLQSQKPPEPRPLRRARFSSSASIEARKAFAKFCQADLNQEIQFIFTEENFSLVGDKLYLVPPGAPDLEGLRTIRSGWWLGTTHPGQSARGHRFEPSHALALGLQAGDARRELDLEASSTQASAYLHGEVLNWSREDGWVLILVDRYPLGWGRGVQGRLKNHYPRGLRWV